VAESWLPSVDFPQYLEAKVGVDDESLNARVRSQVRRRLRRLGAPRLLDIGTGTGAMLRRLLRFLPLPQEGPVLLCGLDGERRGLEVAAEGVRSDLAARGFPSLQTVGADRFEISVGGGSRAAAPGDPGLRVSLVRGGLFDGTLRSRLEGGRFDVISAHALLDLLPLGGALAVIRGLLRPGGLLYATLNYDGLTTLIPPYRDPGLEVRLLEGYERSMEDRRLDGRATGGRFCGRRLCATLPEQGYALVGAGASDWAVFPGRGGHSDGRRVFLRAVLTFMAGEALNARELSPSEVQRWYRERLQAVADGSLALVAHQLDVLAEVRP
jgi:SAM-dependent methyltransferase